MHQAAGYFLCTIAGTVLGEQSGAAHSSTHHHHHHSTASSSTAPPLPWKSARHLGGLIATAFQLGNSPRSVSFVLRGGTGVDAPRYVVVAQRNTFIATVAAWPIPGADEGVRSSFASLMALWLEQTESDYTKHFTAMAEADAAFHHGDNFDFHAVTGGTSSPQGLAYDVVEAAIAGHLPPKFVDLWCATVQAVQSQMGVLHALCVERGVVASVGLMDTAPATLRAAVDHSTPLSCFYDGLRCVEALPPPVSALVLAELVQEVCAPSPSAAGKSSVPGACLSLLDANETQAVAVGRSQREPRIVVAVALRGGFLEPIAGAQWMPPTDKHAWAPFRLIADATDVAVCAILGVDPAAVPEPSATS